MTLTYGYLGSTEVSADILDRAPVDPALVVSFDESHSERISGFATYEAYDDVWHTVDSINSGRAKRLLREHDLDVLFVMAWQELLDAEALSIPTHGCVGRHLSLLPKRRGRAPVAWTLLHGLDETGVTLFWLDEGVDSGDVVAQRRVPVDRADEAHDLHARMTDATVALLDDVVPTFESGEFPAEPQDESEATYTHPRRPDMGLVDWTHGAARLYDFVRAQTHPYPGAFTYHRMDRVTAWHARVHHRTAVEGRPGEVLALLDDGPESGEDGGGDGPGDGEDGGGDGPGAGEDERDDGDGDGRRQDDRAYDLRVQCGEGILDVAVENRDDDHPVRKGSVLGCLPRTDGR